MASLLFGNGARSFEVTIARTAGCFWAADRSIDFILAWACGLLKIFPYSMPGKFKSAPYKALPVTLSIPSCRTGLFPIAE